jgi:acyl-CoA synthetase (AMP-forming)/AMP-acid ligase II
MILPLTPLRFLERAQRLYGEKTGIVCGLERFSYAAYFERCCRLAAALGGLGVRQGDRVAFLGHNCHRLLEAYYGVLQARAVLLPLNIRLAPAEIAFILRDSEARVVFVDPEFLLLVDGIRAELTDVTFVLLEKPPARLPAREALAPAWLAPKSYDELLAEADPAPFDFMQIDDSSLAELFYTSGTSGDPKGVMLSHRTVYLHGLTVIAAQRTSDRSVQLHTIPLFHANGWGCAHSITGACATHVMIRKFEPQRVFQLVEMEKATSFCMVPTMANLLVQDPDAGRYDLSSLEWVLIGGAAAAPELVRQVERKLGCKCYCAYGLTETSPLLTIAFLRDSLLSASPEEQLRFQASTGQAQLGVELRVVDDAGCDVPKDGRTMGEIVARGDGVMDGYWRQPEATQTAFRDGWLRTGDMAVWDKDGYLLIVDRQKEIIISGGENISSLEVEKALITHPAIYECAVIAVPDEMWGEVPKAFVVLKKNSTASEEELATFLKGCLAKYKIPRSFEFVSELPKGGTGKIQKKILRQKYWAGQEKRVH